MPAARIKTAATNPFSMPWGIQLEVLSSQNWNTWSGMMTALLQLNSTVESDVDFLPFTEKFDRLRETYGGVGSTALFILWVELLQARLDDTSPLTPQLAQLTETRVKLSNSGMGVSYIQYYLILLSALLESCEVVASTLLASGPASSLEHSEITARILVGIWVSRQPLTRSVLASRNYHVTTVTSPARLPQKKRDEAENEKEEEESTSSNRSTDNSNGDTESEKAVTVFERVHAY